MAPPENVSLSPFLPQYDANIAMPLSDGIDLILYFYTRILLS